MSYKVFVSATNNNGDRLVLHSENSELSNLNTHEELLDEDSDSKKLQKTLSIEFFSFYF